MRQTEKKGCKVLELPLTRTGLSLNIQTSEDLSNLKSVFEILDEEAEYS